MKSSVMLWHVCGARSKLPLSDATAHGISLTLALRRISIKLG